MEAAATSIDNVCYRRLSADAISTPSAAPSLAAAGFQRTRSIRASFRLLGSRWKAPSAATAHKSDSTDAVALSGEVVAIQTSVPSASATSSFKKVQNKYKSDRFHKTKQKKLRGIRNNATSKLAKENWQPTAMPEYIPAKAAAILEIPIDREQFNRKTSQFLMMGEPTKTATVAPPPPLTGLQFRFLKRSVSLNNEAAQKKETAAAKPPRTATIRRGSVWANSTLSKEWLEVFFFTALFYFNEKLLEDNFNSEVV